MQNSIDHLEKELLNIRAGKANPSMLSSIKLDYYGAMTLLSQLANINTPDSQTISIQPWEKDKLQDIEKAILSANIGFNPMNNLQIDLLGVFNSDASIPDTDFYKSLLHIHLQPP